MNSVLFICHRPYHYFVSAIIAKQNKLKYPRSTHYCINFDVYTFKTNNKKVDYSKNCKLSKYDTLLSDKSIFNETYWLSRKNEKGIWNIVKFYKYYNDTVDDFKRLIANFSSCDNLYIFSDKEKPVEILSLLMIERFQPKVYLFDEGVVSYNYKNNYSSI